jgi:hypothetical protein
LIFIIHKRLHFTPFKFDHPDSNPELDRLQESIEKVFIDRKSNHWIIDTMHGLRNGDLDAVLRFCIISDNSAVRNGCLSHVPLMLRHGNFQGDRLAGKLQLPRYFMLNDLKAENLARTIIEKASRSIPAPRQWNRCSRTHPSDSLSSLPARSAAARHMSAADSRQRCPQRLRVSRSTTSFCLGCCRDWWGRHRSV